MSIRTPLLGLNIIVGPDDKDVLDRCLKSCQGELFDEIVITLAMEKEDPEIKALAESYGAKTFFFKWVQDFSAARNFSFSNNTSEYIMWCLTPDSRVHTERGLISISEVCLGDKVLTHTGRYMPVTKLYKQPFSGDIYRISSKYSGKSIGVTPNHEFLGCQSYSCKTGIKFCKPDCKKQYSKRYLKKYGKLSRQCKQGYTEYAPQFIPIDKLHLGDILSFPKLKQTIYNSMFVNLLDYPQGKKELPDKIEITPEVMRLFGYFVAEGTVGANYLSFCFHKKETSYQDDVIYLMNRIFNISGTKVFSESNGCNVTFNSITLSKFFKSYFSGLQSVRKLPNELLGLSDKHLSEFIKGYYRGDGGENPDSFAITTSSPYLVEQIRLILSRFGIMGECIPYKTKNAWKVRVGGKSISAFQDIISETHSEELRCCFNKNFYSDNDFLYHQIDEYTKEFYEGEVYNLEVSEDHSYVTEYMVTHNCDSDDIIKPSEYKKLLDLKPKIKNWDITILNYVYSHDEKDAPVLILPRERIVKNCEHIKWHDPIHEYMNLDVPPNKIHRENINIDHYRIRVHNPARNIEALKKIYESNNCSERIKFYYGKELADFGMWEKAILVLDPYIKKGADFADNLTTACIKLSRYYFEKSDYSSSKSYALKGIRFNSIYAENYVVLGNIFEQENDTDTAVSYYKEALNKKLEGGMSQIIDYYGFIPAAKLALLYYNRKEYDSVVKYCTLALMHKPGNEQMSELLKITNIEMARLSKGMVLQEEDIFKLKEFLQKNDLNMSVLRNNIDFCDIRLNKVRDIKVVWFIPALDLTNPSIRLRRINICQQLVDMGIDSTIITNYYGNSIYEIRNRVGDATVAIFTQFGKEDLEIMKHLKSSDIKCVFDHCEALFNFPFERECMGEADLITCCSTKLKELTNEHGFMKTVVLKDAVEKTSNKIVYEDRYIKPKAIYVGMGGNSWLISDYLKDTIEEAGYEIVLCTEWDNATHRWTEDGWVDVMNSCDVVLCPQRVDVQPAKSSVKATVAMALGLPVICSPLQAYKEIIRDGENGFICDTKEEWRNALIKLKDSTVRKKIGEAGKASIGDYSLSAISGQWISTLTELINNQMKFPDPPEKIDVRNRSIVDIIIANYNNVEYLKMCVSSILMNTLYPFHIIISDGGSNKETWDYLLTLKGITVIGDPNKRLSFSETCNAGIKASNTKYFVILNSDVIVSKCWLTSLVNKMETVDRLASCGVLSNCDRSWLHDAPGKPSYSMLLEKSKIDLHPAMKIDEIKPYVEELYKFMEDSNKKHKDVFVSQGWVAAYATIFARCAINEVGLFDPLFLNGCEDLDLMNRLTKYGYKTGQAIDSFVFHFGGISRGSHQMENKEAYDKEDVENHLKYRAKWAKPKVVIWTGPAWEPWNKQKVDEGMAGSETWASYLAREFVKKGFETTIYNDLLSDSKDDIVLDPVFDAQGVKIGDVVYRDHTKLQTDVEYDVIDYFIASRSTEPLKLNIHSLVNDIMIHDIWLSSDKNYDTMTWRVRKYAYLSEWHKNFLSKHHGILSDQMIKTSNGINWDLYNNVDRLKKKKQMVWSSSPDRGLYEFLLMLPEIKRQVPDFELIVAYGFYNWEKAAVHRNNINEINYIKAIKELMNQNGVKYVGRVSKIELAELQKESMVWLYSTAFTETFGITAVENGAAYNAILCTNLAGLIDTVGDGGILIDGLNSSKEYREEFIDQSVRLLTDEDFRNEWAEKANTKMKEYNWEIIADNWIKSWNK